MGIILVSILLIILGIYFIAIEKTETFGEVLLAFGIAILLYGGIGAIASPDVNSFEKNYVILREELDIYHSCEEKVSYTYLSYLDEEMTDINKRIERNKKYCNTFWLGWYHSEKIAQYEPFDINKELK